MPDSTTPKPPTPEVPAGYVLAPRIPSDQMREAGDLLRYSGAAIYDAEDIYHAMISASPIPGGGELGSSVAGLPAHVADATATEAPHSAGGWRPIESAPSRVLMVGADHAQGYRAIGMVNANGEFEEADRHGKPNGVGFYPTHWMPLPDTPIVTLVSNSGGPPQQSILTICGYDVRLTCSACPEQYDVFWESAQVGYLRLRHGSFRADCPVCGGETVFEGEPMGDGAFEPEERLPFLTAAVAAIDLWRAGRIEAPSPQNASQVPGTT